MRDAHIPNQPFLAEGVLDEDGHPPCDPPASCSVCCLFDTPRPGETTTDWGTRIYGQMMAGEYRRTGRE